MIVKGKRKAESLLGKKLSDPKYTGKKFFVLSETGKRLFGGYKTETEAKKRLGQVEFFKRRGNPGQSIACGKCYRWAFMDVQDKGGTLVHGVVQEPLSSPPRYYDHAWVERDGRVYDEKTMEGPHGGKFSGIGYPIDVYKELFKPRSTTRYTSQKAWRVLQDEGGHYGPWENPKKRVKKKAAKKKAAKRRGNPGHEDLLPGGLADKMKPRDFCPRALKKGTKVEMEHTGDRRLAQEIAMDHLAEHPGYYDALEKMEGELEGNPGGLAKDVKKLLKAAEKQGCVILKGRKHYKIRCPKGRQFTVASSPSDRRALQNIRRDFRHIAGIEMNPSGSLVPNPEVFVIGEEFGLGSRNWLVEDVTLGRQIKHGATTPNWLNEANKVELSGGEAPRHHLTVTFWSPRVALASLYEPDSLRPAGPEQFSSYAHAGYRSIDMKDILDYGSQRQAVEEAVAHADDVLDSHPGGPYRASNPKKRSRKRVANPKPFWDRAHKWDEVLISKDGRRKTRKQILDYYQKNAKKIWPYLKGQTVMVIFGRGRNDFVLRRKGPDGSYIKLTKLDGIDDPHSFEYWIHRRVIEFHPVITGKTTGLIWIDIDPYRKAQAKSMAKMQRQIRKAVPLMKRLLKDEFGVTTSYVWRSGKKDGGWHIEGDLPKKMNVDKLRRKLRGALDTYFADDPAFTTTIAKSGQIRLDTTLTKTMGSLRAPYSYTVDGSQKLPVEVSGIAPKRKVKRSRNPESLAWRWPFMGNKAEGTMTVEELEAIADPNCPLDVLAREDAAYIMKLKGDIQLRGFVNPVIVKVGRGIGPYIFDGHHRVIIARQLGIKEVPVAYYKANPGKAKQPAKPLKTKRKARKNPELTEAQYEQAKVDAEARRRPDVDHLELGGSRLAYDIKLPERDAFIFKADQGSIGTELQTEKEVENILKGSYLFPEMYDYDRVGYRWVELEKLKPFKSDADSRSQFRRFTGIDWEDFDFSVNGVPVYPSDANIEMSRNDLVKSQKSEKFFNEIVRLWGLGLSPWEMTVIENWGTTLDGKSLKYLDVGA